MNYIKISDAVDELSAVAQDQDRVKWLTYMICAKQVMRDIKVKYLNDFKRVYLVIDKATNTVRLPFDYFRFRTISIIQDCVDAFGKRSEKVIPLTQNPYINITPQTDPIDACATECGCNVSHPVCTELSNFEAICEDVIVNDETIGVKQTILRTCPNGDIIKEVSQPVQKFEDGEVQCDYAVDMEVNRPICDYRIDFTAEALALNFPISIAFNINGEYVSSPALNNINAMENYMEDELGWELTGDVIFELHDSFDIYYNQFNVLDDDGETTQVDIQRHCEVQNSLLFPYYIDGYVLNDEEVTVSPDIEIENQDDLDEFFEDLGFDKVDATHYTKSGTTDVYSSILILTQDSPAQEITISITQSNCVTQIVVAGIENMLTSDVLCNVEVKAGCGCIVESASCISTIVNSCSSYLSCCQQGQLTNYNGWGFVPESCPTNSEQPYNARGTFNIDERNYLIYLDSVSATKVLLAYDNDGSCDGQYYLPDYCIPAIKAGCAWYYSQYNEEYSPQRRRELEMNYSRTLTTLANDYTDPIRMSDLINALRTKKYPY